MIVASLALIVACSGTAVAAGVFINSPNQLRNGVVTGAKIASGTITAHNLARGSVGSSALARNAVTSTAIANGQISTSKLTPDTVQALQSAGTTASEFFRKSGPDNQPSGASTRVLTADNVPSGVYAIFAKTILTDLDPSANLLSPGKTADGHCELGAGGDLDEGRVLIGGAFGSGPGSVTAQITHTFAGPGTITLTCDAGSAWRASDTSIIAIRLGNASRVALAG